MKRDIMLKVNGIEYNLNIDTHRTLVEVLRETLGLTGTKKHAMKASAVLARFL